MKTTMTLIIGLVAGLIIGWFAGQQRHGSAANLHTEPQSQSMEAQAKQVAESTHRSATWWALVSLQEQNLNELAVAMKVPDDVSKMEAKTALNDPNMKSYSPYFHSKYAYELTRQIVQEQQNGNP
jgi:hypothetical protein